MMDTVLLCGIVPISDRFIEFTSHGETPATPPDCPKCESSDTGSAAKPPTLNSYWRCRRCGQVWNPSQLASRPAAETRVRGALPKRG